MLSIALPSLISDPVIALGLITFSLLLCALPIAFWSLSSSKYSSTATTLVALANLFITAQLTLRWLNSGHFPISNLYESLCFLTWGCTFTQLVVQRIYPSPLVASATTPMALLLIAFASFALPDTLQQSSPLVPALRSSWLVMHVTVIMCSYAALIIGSLLSFIVLFSNNKTPISIRSSSLGIGGISSKVNIVNSEEFEELAIPNSFSISTAEKLDSLSYRTITVGFLLLTVGLISGAVWANEAWGSWWSWDPKETWALICWLVYAAYLHTRLTRGWQGKKPALLASLGLIFISICYIGVNLLGVGLHSYGWFFDS